MSKLQKFSRIFKSKRYIPKVNLISPKVNLKFPKVNLKCFFLWGGSRHMGFRKSGNQTCTKSWLPFCVAPFPLRGIGPSDTGNPPLSVGSPTTSIGSPAWVHCFPPPGNWGKRWHEMVALNSVHVWFSPTKTADSRVGVLENGLPFWIRGSVAKKSRPKTPKFTGILGVELWKALCQEWKSSLNIKFLGGIFLGHQGPRHRDIPDKNFMQVAFWCCFREWPGCHGIWVGTSRIGKLHARKLWADFSFLIVSQFQQFPRVTSIGSLPPKNLGKSRGPPQNPAEPCRTRGETSAEPSERPRRALWAANFLGEPRGGLCPSDGDSPELYHEGKTHPKKAPTQIKTVCTNSSREQFRDSLYKLSPFSL